MSGRVKLVEDDDAANVGGNYFAEQQSPLQFVDSGCALLNCVLGGGWPLSRIANVVGDSSTGKTLIAIEALANFRRRYPKGKMFYRESETAFDEQYAEALGMPVDEVQFIDPEQFATIEDFYDDLKACVEVCGKRGEPGFYVVDSLDALTSKDEQDRGFGEASYGMEKAKQMGKLFRMCVADIGRVDMCLMVISQTRDKIGITFGGPKKTRSGGRALDFYASQVLWLSQRDKLSETKDKVKRVTGVHVRAQMQKSKIALPYRECDFTIRFGHGIDSLSSCLDWLEDVKRLDEVIDSAPLSVVGPTVSRRVYEGRVDKLSNSDYWAEVRRVDAEVVRLWRDIEANFMDGVRTKYRE